MRTPYGGRAPEVTLSDGGLTVVGLLPTGVHIDVAVAAEVSA